MIFIEGLKTPPPYPGGEGVEHKSKIITIFIYFKNHVVEELQGTEKLQDH